MKGSESSRAGKTLEMPEKVEKPFSADTGQNWGRGPLRYRLIKWLKDMGLYLP